MQDRVSVSVSQGIADVRLNRPDKLNALDIAMFDALVAAGLGLRSERGLRAVVLSGAASAPASTSRASRAAADAHSSSAAPRARPIWRSAPPGSGPSCRCR